MFLGSLKKQINIDGYINNDLLEPLSLKNRHDILADELIKRGYNHNSPLDFDETQVFSYLSSNYINHKIDKNNSLKLLISRCNKCQSNNLINQQGDIRGMYGITKSFKFESSHRLMCMGEGHPCSKIHGHSYVVRVSIFIEDIKKMKNPNMVVDFSLLKTFQEDLNEMDHAIVLNSKDPMLVDMAKHNQKIVIMPFELDPTAENMAFLFANKINYMCLNNFGITQGNIQIEVDETVGNTAMYMREIA